MTKETNITRRVLREKTLQILYAYEQSNDNLDILFTELLSDIKNEDSISFVKNLCLRTINERDNFDEMLKKHIQNWEVGRVALIDKILIRIAICEFLFFDDIPPKVSINEAIEIAKRYSTDQSDKFINGVLDAIFKSLNDSKKIKKTGRGLLNYSHSNPEDNSDE